MASLTRAKSEYLDDILGDKFSVLDHGFVRVIDYQGNDQSVVQMARVSYGAGTKTPSEDWSLIRYLMRNRHTSPFEGCEIKLHVRLPIFVARQWIRHRTANVNEVSGRYSVLPAEFYVPESGSVKAQSSSNKQGRGDDLHWTDVENFRNDCALSGATDFAHYEHHLYRGVARELARINLPVSTYTEWYWKIDLHNLLHFLALRLDPHAQWEIRQYADVIADIVKGWVPHTYQAFVDYRLEAVTLSKHEIAVLREMIARENLAWVLPVRAAETMSSREIDEFAKKLALPEGDKK